MINTDWWRDFFTGTIVDLWLAVPNDEMTRSEVDFLEKSLQLQAQSRILDVPCGGGRHCIELAARGHHLTGVDISADFLIAARKSSAERKLDITWEHRSMTDLPWANSFDAAYCFGNSFGYLDDEGNAQFLKSVAQSLKPKSRFAIDTSMVAECFFSVFQERRWFPVGDMLFLSHGRYDPASARLETDYTIIRDGKSDTRTASTRVYGFRELCQLMTTAGFSDIEAFGSLNRDRFQHGSQRCLIVANKG